MAATSLSDDERQVIEKKYAARQVGQMEPAELALWSKTLLMKIHVITGWTIPASAEMVTILNDQFSKFLVERYPNMNPEEVEYAFRNYGTQIKDWGKALNLQLVDSVLLPYLNDRYRISETERQIAWRKTRKDFDFKSDIDWRRMINEDYQHYYFQGSVIDYPSHYYDVLTEDGFIEPDFYQLRARMYSRKWPEVPRDIIIATAKQRTIVQLFRHARLRRHESLYL